jgi:hypothetical protein
MNIIEGSVLDPAVIAERERQAAQERYERIMAQIKRKYRLEQRRRNRGDSDRGHDMIGNDQEGLADMLGLNIGFDLEAAVMGFAKGTLSTANPISGLITGLISGVTVSSKESPSSQSGHTNSKGQQGISGLGDTSGHGGQGDGDPGGTGGGGGGVGDGQGGGPAGASCCFIAGTKVLSQVGHKNIEDIEAGDIVRSYDLDTGNFVESIVGTTKSVIRDVYYEIHFESGNVLSVTDDHPLYTREGWASIKPHVTEANELYDRIDSINELTQSSAIMHESGHFDNVIRIKRIKGKVTTYTLGNIAPNANFFAGLYLASNYAC